MTEDPRFAQFDPPVVEHQRDVPCPTCKGMRTVKEGDGFGICWACHAKGTKTLQLWSYFCDGPAEGLLYPWKTDRTLLRFFPHGNRSRLACYELVETIADDSGNEIGCYQRYAHKGETK